VIVQPFNHLDDKVGGSVDTKVGQRIFSFASVIFGTYMSEMWLPNEVNVHPEEIRAGAENSHIRPKLTTLPTGRGGGRPGRGGGRPGRGGRRPGRGGGDSTPPGGAGAGPGGA
jgi:hypothetical protein